MALLGAAAPAAQAAHAASLSLDVIFSATGTISVSLPDGTPVGTTSGAPTIIPAGYYQLMLSGPGGCTLMPSFDLKGPGVDIVDNMTEGEVTSEVYNAYFLPNTTYTWRNDSTVPTVVYSFTTSSAVTGTPPPAPTSGAQGISSSLHSTATSQDVVGSSIVPFRGTISGVLSATGKLTLSYHGRQPASLTAGRYTISLTDKGSRNGLSLQAAGHSPLTVSGAGFVGRHTASVDLSVGTWRFVTGKSGTSVVVG